MYNDRELTKKEITELILNEMLEMDLVYVRFWWDQSKVFFGRVYWNDQKILQGIYVPVGISLSEIMFNVLYDKWHMVDTIYHELAHIIAVAEHNDPTHSSIWEAQAIKLGAIPRAWHEQMIDTSKMALL